MKNLLFSLVLATISLGSVHSQDVNIDDIEFDNQIYVDYIKSVEFGHSSVELSLPIIDLNSMGELTLDFDDIRGDFTDYIYSLVHCDKDWNPTPFQNDQEYLDGFNNEEIDGFGYSTNGYSEYTHYSLTLPNDDVTWIISGNYLLIIRDLESDKPVLTRRFVVAENAVTTSVIFTKPQNTKKLHTHHEVALKIKYDNLRISRPKQELSVTMLQNGNWENANYNVQGTYERGKELIFDDYDSTNFPALKEFRNFDIRTLDTRTEFVRRIHQDDHMTFVTLDTLRQRLFRNYSYEPDANGGFIVDNVAYRDPDVSSEYVEVSFALYCDEPVQDDMYLIGAFSDWKPREEFKMTYDPSSQLYVTHALFKQGYYDYTYATVDSEGAIDLSSIEGSWHETENDYQFIVYFREFAGEYDRVLNVVNVNSNPR